jgi:hypothetical protein
MPSEAPAVKGTLEQFIALRLFESYDNELFPAFVIVKMVVASIVAGVKDFGSGGVHADEQLTYAGSTSARDPPVQVKASHDHGANVLDIVLVLRHAETIDYDVVYGLLMECLQDVSSNALVLHTFVIWFLTLD